MHKEHKDIGTVIMDNKPKRRYPPEYICCEQHVAKELKRISRNGFLKDYSILPTILVAKCAVMHIGGRNV